MTDTPDITQPAPDAGESPRPDNAAATAILRNLPEAAPQAGHTLADRLHLTAERIKEWRLDAGRLRAVLAADTEPVDPALLLAIEETSGRIYREIEAFDAIVANIDKHSHAAAAEIASVGDALRLALMEITELGTAMYSRQSIPIKV